jgi:lysozyme
MITPPMEYSADGMLLTQSFESCVLTPYQDIRGIWTDGWGNTHNVIPNGPAISQEQADAELQDNLSCAVAAVNQYVDIEITQEEFDALVDFVFNCGVSAFKDSTMLKLLNAGDLNGAANEFPKWDHAAGQVVAGLLRRRLAEKKEFLG